MDDDQRCYLTSANVERNGVKTFRAGTYESVDYDQLSEVKMYWDYRSVLAPNKLRCLVTGVTVTLEGSILSVDANNKLNVADAEWKTILYEGVAAAMGTENFALYMSGVFSALGADGGYFKVGDSVGTTTQTPNIYGPGVSLRAGGSGTVLDDNNWITGSANLTVAVPFTGATGILVNQGADSVYKSFRGTTDTSGTTTTTSNGGGSFTAKPWNAFSTNNSYIITYGNPAIELDMGPVKNWAHGVALPKNSVMDFACVTAFKDGLPTTAQIDADLDHMKNFNKLPPWWR